MNKKIKQIKQNKKRNLGNSLLKNLIIGFILLGSFVTTFATAHLPPALLNIVNQTEQYLSISTYLMIPLYSLISIINPLYLLLGLIYLTFSLLYFKKKSHHIIFLSSFILANAITYYFQAGLVGIFMAKDSNANIIIYLGLFILLLATILTSLIGLKKIKSKDICLKFLALSSGIGFGLFFLQIPGKITVALKFGLSYAPYFARFLFSFKIFFFLILSLLPMVYLVYIIKNKKYKWTLKVHKFFSKNKDQINYALIFVLTIIFILSYIYRNYLIY